MNIIGACYKRKPTPFGMWIKTTLLEEDIKQKDLAKKIGIPSQNITRIIYGEVKESKHTASIIDILAKSDEEKAKALAKI